MNAGLLLPKPQPDNHYLSALDCDSQYEDTLTSVTTSDSEITKPNEKEP